MAKSLKKSIPYEIRSIVEEIFNDKYDHYRFEKKNKEELITIFEIDEDSDFYFTVEKPTMRGYYSVIYSPSDLNNLNYKSGTVHISEIKEILDNWVRIIDKINEPSILDDPIINGYKKEIFNIFIEDPEENYNEPFNFEQQASIDKFLEIAITGINSIKDEMNQSEYSLFAEKLNETKSSLHKQSKRTVLDNLANILAHARKIGGNCYNLIYRGFFTSIGAESGKYVISEFKSFITTIGPFISDTIIIP